jgi:hypothetical protein
LEDDFTMSFLIGFEGTLLVNTAVMPAGYATPTWAELDTVSETAILVESKETEINMRRGGGWGSNLATIRNAPIEIKAVYEQGNANLTRLRDASLNPKMRLDMLILDGRLIAPVGGVASTGLRAWFTCTKWKLGQNVADGQMLEATLKLAWFPVGQGPQPFTGTVAV